MSEHNETGISNDTEEITTPALETENNQKNEDSDAKETDKVKGEESQAAPEAASAPYQEQPPAPQASPWQERPNPEQQVGFWQNQQPPQNQQNLQNQQPQQNQQQPNSPQYPGQQNAPWQNQQPPQNQPQYPGQQNAPWQNQQPPQNQPQYPGQQNAPWQNQQPPQNQPQYPGQQNAPWQNQQFPNYPNPGTGNYYQNQNPNFQNGNFQNQYMQNQNMQGQPGMNRPPANPMAVTSLALGIISMLVSCCCFPIGFIIGFVLAMVGLVLAISSKKGKPFSGYAIAGLVLSILGICESLFLFFSYLITARMMQDPNISQLMNQLMEQYEKSMGPQMIHSMIKRFL